MQFLFAVLGNAPTAVLSRWMMAWILVRLLYIGAYAAGKGTIRSILWAIALALNIVILFLGV